MATVGTSLITLADIKKAMDPDGKIAKIIEILEVQNSIAMDMHWQEGNLDVGHRHTIRSGLPTPAWRLLNYGTVPTKGTTKQVDDMCGMLEAVCDIDIKEADLNGNKAAYRWTQDMAHIQGMDSTLESAIWYGNQASDPEKITGLSPRYAAGDTAQDSDTSADNVLNAASTTTGSDLTSVWLLSHSPSHFFGIYPKGMKAGLQHDDRGIQDKTDSSGRVHRVYRSFYSWDCGVALADWRYAVRIANIDVSDLQTDDGTVSAGANLITWMIKAMHRMPKKNQGKLIFYGNEQIETYLDLQTLKQSNMHVKYSDSPHGERIMTFRGVPFHRSDALIIAEDTVEFS
jgi:hypothetical protein